MAMSNKQPKTIVIVGGSLGGLLVGVALKRLKKDLSICIFERNPTPLLHDQGAGVVAGQDTQNFFKHHDRTNTPLTVTSHQRRYLDRQGYVIRREDNVQQMTSWDLLYHVLRANFDGVESKYAKAPDEDGTGTTTYEYGCTVTDVAVPEASSSAPLNFSDPVEVKVKRHSGESFSTTADLVIAADGPSSAIRSLYFPKVQREYAGYVAWRGTVTESQLSQSTLEAFAEKFVFFHDTGTQILAYLVPGQDGTLDPGHRLLNYVWYCNYRNDSPEHTELMTDNDGSRHHITLPPGGIREHVWTRQKERALAMLPPQFAELVQKTTVPFVQAITDVIAPSALLADGRVLLVGDALAGFRPHTAASTGQAAMNAMTLAEALSNVLDGCGLGVLDAWDANVVRLARDVQAHGVRLGDRSQFGVHPYRG